MTVRRPPAFGPGDRHGHLEIIALLLVGQSQRLDEYQVRLLCCGRERRMRYEHIIDRMRKRTGHPASERCRDCMVRGPAPATDARRPAPPPLVLKVAADLPTVTAPVRLPPDLVGPDRSWPRLPSLSRRPDIWGTQW